MKKKFFLFLFFPFICNSFEMNSLQKNEEFIQDLNSLKYNLSINYAPMEWKKNFLNWDINHEFNIASQIILSGKIKNAENYHHLVKKVFKSLQDYHVSTEFYSRSISFFPLVIEQAENKYFITKFDLNLLYVNLDWVDLHWLESNENYIRWHQQVFNDDHQLLLEPGTELLAINDIPIKDYIENILYEELGNNKTATSYTLATRMLFKRIGKRGHLTPEGTFTLTIKEKSNKVKTLTLPWLHFSEDILARELPSSEAVPPQTIAELKKKMEKDFSVSLAKDYIPKYQIDEKTSLRKTKGFLPDLGEKLWIFNGESSLYAYLYTNDLDQLIGYIYLPTFHYDKNEEMLIIKDLEKILLKFKKSADALVLDITNNSGGYLSFMYKILSMISNTPIKTYLEKEIINPSDIHDALILTDLLKIEFTKQKNNDKKNELIELINYFSTLINNFKEGKNISDLIYIYGKEYILPDRKIFFNKPIILLINELDFSCADFFPALLQDNKIAYLFGKNTAGAGGAVNNYFPFSKFGVKRFSLTGTISYRHNGQPIENLGVSPDLPYEITIRDLKENYVDYINTLNKIIIKIINNQ